MTYDPSTIEAEQQEAWRRAQAFVPAPEAPGRRNTFVYACTPFTTGKIHMGHVRSYTIADACARRARSQGDAVLWAMGFDAFGLPNEVAAIRQAIAPADWVKECSARMAEQFDRLGLSVDWSRCFVTSEPEYYRWTQWIFLRFLERGLVHRAEGIENWCAACGTVLASLQVTGDGRCWRCDGPVELTSVPQWYLTFDPYLEALDDGLERLSGWDEGVLQTQRALLGRTDGVDVDVVLPGGRRLVAFCAGPPDGIGDATFVAVSPNHPDVARLVGDRADGQELERLRRRGIRRDERSTERVPVLLTGIQARVPGLDGELPVVITPAVDVRFGGGAALGLPGTDARDAAIAAQAGVVVAKARQSSGQVATRPASRFQLRPSSVSRQRGWGAPVPVIHCDACGAVPVPDADLPVQLPGDLEYSGEGSPLERHPTFALCTCPACGAPARRDTDTLDVHFDSIWMLVPFCVPTPARAEEMFTHPDLERWLPVAQVVCGADQAAWWVNDRLCFKVLADAGYLAGLAHAEPVSNILMHGMVLASGQKMSKSLGNATDPDELIDRYGADAVRLAVLSVNPRKAFDWTESAVQEGHRFLADLWSIASTVPASPGVTSHVPLEDTARSRDLELRCAAIAAKAEQAYERRALHLVTKDVKRLLGSVKTVVSKAAEDATDRWHPAEIVAVNEALAVLLDLLEPLAPHIATTLRERMHDDARKAGMA